MTRDEAQFTTSIKFPSHQTNRIDVAKTGVAITIISDSDEMCHNVSSNVTLFSDI